ncbi:hypothetical protein vseg_002360 [Gypsophila vaccaria]
MFTPKKKVLFGWSSTSRTFNPRIPEDFDDLNVKVANLEKELFEYQYNMELLLIEKKEWSSKFENLLQALDEQNDALKREQTSHLSAISNFEKREDDLRKALGVEKQCVHDLEKALRDIRSEYAEIKFTADSKLAEANALASSIEEKALEVETKLHAADAKFAEASRKSLEMKRKLQDLERREGALRRERTSFYSGKDAHEAAVSKQRQELLEWERKLQEGEERLCESRRILNQREARANEIDQGLKLKEIELQEAQKKIEETNVDLTKKQEDISRRLFDLTVKEKEFDTMAKSFARKEKELNAHEQQLNEREKNEMQKLLVEHKAHLDAKKQKFEFEMDQRRSSVDEELKSRVMELEKKKIEVKHMEEKISKRENALDKKLEKCKEKENDLELRTNALKEKEKAVKEDQKSLGMDKQQLLKDTEELLKLKEKLEDTKAANEKQLQKIREEKEHLRLTEEERSKHSRLQSELKREIDQCRTQREVVLKEAAELKQERLSFELEWEALDEKKAEIQRELYRLTDEREKWEKWRHMEEERLSRESLVSRKNIEADREALELDKESFDAYMEQEKALLSEREQAERRKNIDDFERQERDLDEELLKLFEEKEMHLRKRERLFEEERERERNNINNMKHIAERGMCDLKDEERRMAKQLEEVTESKKQMEERRLSVQKDVDELVVLSSKLKEQREQLLNERERFISFAERLKSCGQCWEVTNNFLLTDLQYLRDENDERSPVPSNVGTPTPAKSTSWLRKCTEKILKLSPIQKGGITAIEDTTGEASPSDLDIGPASNRYDFIEEAQELSVRVVSDSFDVQRAQAIDDEEPSVGGWLNSGNGKDHEASQNSNLIGQQRLGKRERGRISRTHSVEAVLKDARNILGDSLELSDSLNGDDDGSLHLDGRNQELSENLRKGRKRGRFSVSQITASEQDEGEGDVHSDSIAGGGPRSRRRKVTPDAQMPAEKRYNLRRPKPVDMVAAVKMSPGSKRGRKGNPKIEKPEGNSRLRPSDSAGVASDDDGSVNLMQAAVEEEAHEFSTPKIHRYHRTTEITVVSEEVNEAPASQVEYADGYVSGDGSVGSSSGDEEVVHPGKASIGKKLWKFLTT